MMISLVVAMIVLRALLPRRGVTDRAARGLDLPFKSSYPTREITAWVRVECFIEAQDALP
jgi:hypothetical protein